MILGGRTDEHHAGGVPLAPAAPLPSSRPGRRAWAPLVLVAATGLANLSGFAFHVVLSRGLGPAGYGAFAAVAGILTTLTIPLGALETAVAREIARRGGLSERVVLRRFLGHQALAGVVLGTLVAASAPLLTRFLGLRSGVPLLLVAAWALPATCTFAATGLLLARSRFSALAASLLGNSAVRLVAGDLLVRAHTGVIGAFVATLAAAATGLGIALVAVRDDLRSSAGVHLSLPLLDAGRAVLALGGIGLLAALDSGLARHLLPAVDAGRYAVAATAGRIAAFAPGAVAVIAFPRLLAAPDAATRRRTLQRALLVEAVASAASASLLWSVRRATLVTLFGHAYEGASPLLGRLAVASACLAVVTLLTLSALANGSWTALVPPVAAGMLALVALEWRPDASALAGLVAATNAIAALLLLLDGRGTGSARAPARRRAGSDQGEVVRHDPRPELSPVPRRAGTVAHLVLASAGTAPAALPDARPRPAQPRRLPSPCPGGAAPGSDAGGAVALERPASLDASVVVPFYNAGLAVHRVVRRTVATLRARGLSFEVIPVSDGSTDGADQGLERHGPEVRPLRLATNGGKGAALRAGFAAASGHVVAFVDGDGDIAPEALGEYLEEAFATGADLVVGSKCHPRSRVETTWLRTASSFLFRRIAHALVRIDATDPQVGIKVVRRDVLADLLDASVETGFAFDLELLALARRRGYRRVVELPVDVARRGGSTISPVAAARMVTRAVAVAWRTRTTVPPRAPLSRPVRRILVCNWRDLRHPAAGGAEVWVHEVARCWRAHGLEVTVLSATFPGSAREEVIDGVRYLRVGGRLGVYRAARRYYAREGHGRYDLLVDSVNTRPFSTPRWAAGTPVVAVVYQRAKEIWFYETPLPVALLGRFLLEPLWLRRYRRVPVVTISASSRRSLERLGLRHVEVVPPGHHPDGPVPRDDERAPIGAQASGPHPRAKASRPTLCYLGRLAPNKRPDHALRAFALVRSVLPDAELYVIGDGPLRRRLARTAPPGTCFLGRVDEGTKRDVLARSHALVVTSVREGWGLAVTEAAALGTPAVGYDVPGLSDSLRASGGVATPPSIEALAAELVRVLQAARASSSGLIPTAAGVLPWSEVARQVLDVATGTPRRPPVASGRRAPTHPDDPDEATTTRGGASTTQDPRPRLATARLRRFTALAGLSALVAMALVDDAAPRLADRLGEASFVLLGVAAVAALAPGRALAHRRRPRARSESTPPADDPGTSRPARGSRTAWRVTAAGVGAAAFALAQTWFGAGGALANGDVVPPAAGPWLDRVLAPTSWSGSNLGGPATGALALPWAGAVALVHALGGSAALAQRGFYGLLLAAAALGVVVLLRVLGCGPGPAVLAASGYVLSPFVTSEVGINPVFLDALALLPWLVVLPLSVARGLLRLPAAVSSLVVMAPFLGYAAENPPLVLLLAGAPAMVALVELFRVNQRARRRLLVFATVGGLTLAAASAYWAVPLLVEVHTGLNPLYSHSELWTWTEARARPANAFWLDTAWGWDFPSYYPFAPAYRLEPLALLRYLLPLAAFAALLLPRPGPHDEVARHRLRSVGAVALACLALLLLSLGTNFPGSLLFGPLYHLPYGWLLQEPGRFLMAADLGYACLLGLGADALARGALVGTVADLVLSPGARRVTTGAAFAAVALVAPGFPLVTGAVAPGPRPPYPSDHVTLPPYWHDMARTVDRLHVPGAVLVLPTDDFYQMPYRWGYYGADGFLSELLSRPFLDPSPQGYTTAGNELYSAVEDVGALLLARDWPGARRLLDALRAPLVLVRGDVVSGFPGRHLVSPSLLAERLGHDPLMSLVAQAGPLLLYEERQPVGLAPRSLAVVTTSSTSPDPLALALLGPRTAIVTAATNPSLPDLVFAPPLARWANGHDALVSPPLAVPPGDRLEVPLLGVPPSLDSLATARRALGLAVRPAGAGRVRLSLPTGRDLLLTRTGGSVGPWGAVNDCADFLSRAPLSGVWLPHAGPGGSAVVLLRASADAACVDRQLAPWSGTVLVSLAVRSLSGASPRLCLWESPERTCADLPPLPSTPSWSPYRATVPVPARTTAWLFLEAPAPGGGGTSEVEFADVRAEELPKGFVPMALLARPPSATLAASPTVPIRARRRSGPSEAASTARVWAFASPAGEGWRLEGGSAHSLLVDGLWLGAPASGARPPVVEDPAARTVEGAAVASAVVGLATLLFGVAALAAARRRARRPRDHRRGARAPAHRRPRGVALALAGLHALGTARAGGRR